MMPWWKTATSTTGCRKVMARISFWHRVLNLIAPQGCSVCGCRLALGEEVLCAKCNLHLPRTLFAAHATDNLMARRFWGRIPVERAAALFYYEAGSEVSRIVHDMKYHGQCGIGTVMGRMAAEEFAMYGFFNGIDIIIPVPLTRKRQRQRGYNQSEEIAMGVAEVTGLPVVTDAVERITFVESQTHKTLRQRMESMENAFRVTGKVSLAGLHVLVVDDIVTSGATICSCVEPMVASGLKQVSVMSLGVVK